ADLVLLTTPTIEGLDWLAGQAVTAVAMPFGTHIGALDGSSELERSLDAFWHKGIVASASVGNSGDERAHAELTLAPGEERSLAFQPVVPGSRGRIAARVRGADA